MFEPWGLTIAGGKYSRTHFKDVESTRDGMVFESKPAMPVHFTAGCLLASGQELYAVASSLPENNREAYHFSISTGAWTTLKNRMRTERIYAACGLVGDTGPGTGHIVVSGGRRGTTRYTTLADMEVLNLSSLEWSTGESVAVIGNILMVDTILMADSMAIVLDLLPMVEQTTHGDLIPIVDPNYSWNSYPWWTSFP